MAWNEPGGDNRDPWGNRNDKGPPDLDEVLRKLQDRLGSLFGGRRASSGGGGSGGGGGGGQKFGAMSGSLIIVIVLLVLAYNSVYTIDTRERGVVLRFGEFNRTWSPGLNFLIPWPVEKVIKVNVDENPRTQARFQVQGIPTLLLFKDGTLIERLVGARAAILRGHAET